MANNLKKIIVKGASWEVKKVDFSSKEIIASLAKVHQKQEEAFQRKEVDLNKLKSVIKL